MDICVSEFVYEKFQKVKEIYPSDEDAMMALLVALEQIRQIKRVFGC